MPPVSHKETKRGSKTFTLLPSLEDLARGGAGIKKKVVRIRTSDSVGENLGLNPAPPIRFDVKAIGILFGSNSNRTSV